MIDKKILFIAKYAPNSSNTQIPENNVDTIYAQYHHDFYCVLKENFTSVITSTTPEVLNNPDVSYDYVASLLNRMEFRNSEIYISSVLEYQHKAYLGAPPNIRAAAEDKQLAKLIAKYAGVNTAKWFTYEKGGPVFKPNFDPPYFIKPRFGASSKGIDVNSVCESWEIAQEKIGKLFEITSSVIIEEFIVGCSYTCPILDNFGDTKFLPPVKEMSNLKGNIITYEQKRKTVDGLEREIEKDSKVVNSLLSTCSLIGDLVKPLDYTRMDFIINSDGKPYFVEFNVCCNLGKQAAINLSAQSTGISYESLICNIITSSMFRQNITQFISRYKF